ncbi:MAG: hypothetical protein HZB85_03295 [Deltaproteobacteria bacterium]|nr:hypothetical protein [Deltaproteobacteria bacterium]
MIRWESIKSDRMIVVYRTKVPGGWLILVKEKEEASITFYPDPTHAWDGNSI